MSFRTQRLANYFPLSTKLRRDPSSLGQRFMATFAHMLQEHSINNVKLRWDEHLLKPYLGIGHVWTVLLSDEDAYRINQTANGVTKYTYPSIVGTLGVTNYTLDRYEDMVSFLNAPPDRLVAAGTQAFSTYTVWSSASPYTYNSLPRPEKLAIEVANSTFYSRPSRTQDLEYSGHHTVVVRGKDENDIEIREYVEIPDDGVFYTKNIFKSVVEVQTEGFNGDCTVRWFPAGLSYQPDPYRALVFDDFEGQLRLSLTTQVVDATTNSYVLYEANRLKLGSRHRRPGIEPTGNTECLAEVVLLDSSGTPFTAVDLAINHQTSKMYVLDDQGFVHVYDHELSPFDAFSTTETETARTYLELTPLRHRAKYGDTEYLYTDFKRNRFGISSVQIKRTSPGGIVRYLQTDKSTWAASPATIVSSFPDARLPEQTWQDFRFSTEYDELGQWEYVVTTVSTEDTTVYKTAVQVGSLTAQASIDTGVSSPTALGMSKEDWIAVSDGSSVYYFEERVDGWIADPVRNQAIFRSEYDSVEVTY